MADLDDLKRKRDQLTAKIQQAEARQRATAKKAEDRVKVLVGAATLDHLKRTGTLPAGGINDLLLLMDGFLTRSTERTAILGSNKRGSEAFHRVIGAQPNG